jgi:hypothetical protein
LKIAQRKKTQSAKKSIRQALAKVTAAPASKRHTAKKIETLIPITQLTEQALLNIMALQIKKMSYKYLSMSAKTVGGSAEDLDQALQIRAMNAFREFKKRQRARLHKKNHMDAVRYISPRLRTFCFDLARIQKKKVEPMVPMPEGFDKEDGGATVEKLHDSIDHILWKRRLSSTQRQLLHLWKTEQLDERKEPLSALTRLAVKKLRLSEAEISQALNTIPRI